MTVAEFFKAAVLASRKYRHKLITEAVFGQQKSVWRAEIDAEASHYLFSRMIRGVNADICPE